MNQTSERRRLEHIYARYAATPAKQRAWAPGNPGNAAIRAEALGALTALAAVQLAGGGAILDAGCGSGWWLRSLAARGVAPARLHGVDLLDARLAAAAAAAPGATLLAADVRDLPFAAHSFTLVLFFTVLSALDDEGAVRAALAEARRVLVAGGAIAVWEPRVPTPGNRATLRIGGRLLREALGPPAASRTLTVLPPLARRLGARAPRLYPALARVPALRTHRLALYRPAP